MIRTVALGLTYLALLFGFAAAIEALAGGECSDWLTTCSSESLAPLSPAAGDDPATRPESPELR